MLIAEGLSNQEIARQAARLHRHREDPHQQHLRQDGAQGPCAGGALRVSEGAGTAARVGHESPDGVKTAGKKSRGSSRSVHPWACSQAMAVPRTGRCRRGSAGAPRAPRNGPGEVPGRSRYDDPWYDALASGWGESDGGGRAGAGRPAAAGAERRRGGGRGLSGGAAQRGVPGSAQPVPAVRGARRRRLLPLVPGLRRDRDDRARV